MTDRILLANMRFQGRHGVYEHEQLTPQPFEVDVELLPALQPAGIDDDLEQTIDYGQGLRGRPADRRIDGRIAVARGARRGDRAGSV